MITVLIVDDEFLVRIGLKNCVQWNSLGYKVIGESTNGEEAFLMLKEKRPDLVFLDMMMPKMTGLELMEKSKELNLKTKFIVLSCHDEFEFVKKAMQLGALDYVLKLSLKTSKIKSLLDKYRNLFKKSSSKIEIPSNPTPKNHFLLSEYLSNENIIDENIAQNYEKECPSIVFAIKSVATSLLKVESNILYDILIGVFKDYCYFSFHQYTQNIFLILLQSKDNNILDLEYSVNAAYRIKNSLAMCFNDKYVLGISMLKTKLSHLKTQITQSNDALEYSFYGEEVNIYKKSKKHMDDFKKTNYLFQEINRLEKHITLNQKNKTLALLNQILDKTSHKPLLHPNDVRSFGVEIINIYSKQLKETPKDINSLFYEDKKGNLYHNITNCESLKLLQEILINFSNNFFNYINSLTKQKENSQYIILAKEFVFNNYAKNISMSDAARHLNLNESYFSHLFKKYTDITFMDFLNSYRIDKAIELLKTSHMKVSEIAFMVGFNNASYFSRLFKKATGKNPNEIKNLD